MLSAKKAPFPVACFGEILWDLLPGGIFLGGAPANVAYHLSRLGVRTALISAVGRDFLGDEALARIALWPADTEAVARPRRRPTGTVRGAMNAAGGVTYRVAERTAWDCIRVNRALCRQPSPEVLVYGTLALRGGSNRVAFMDLAQSWPKAFRVLDLNLRAPFDRPTAVRFALSYAHFVKLSDGELTRQTGQPVQTIADIKAAAGEFARRHHLARVCVTAGPRGAGLLWDDEWVLEKANPVRVRDTVGAGDAFLAGWIGGNFFRGETPVGALASGCRLGEFVAGRDGATPPYITEGGRPRDPGASGVCNRGP